MCSHSWYREKSSEERTQPRGAPVLIVWVLDENFPQPHYLLPVCQEACDPLIDGSGDGELMVLKAELKSTNRILT